MKRAAGSVASAPGLAPATQTDCAPAGAGALGFFLDARPGQRFCLFYPPAANVAPRGALLYVHPFAEELNQSRRMAALQARAFAAAGYAVLQIDLYGCGDSSGDFSDARWHIWKHDLGLACAWLARRSSGPLAIWSLRLGALLALDLARHAPVPVARLILWHPVIKGQFYINQFLRLHVASQMVADTLHAGDEREHRAGSTLRSRLAAGCPVEVGGYTLAAQLVAMIDRQDALARRPDCPVHWLALAADADGQPTPVVARHALQWRQAGVALDLRLLHGAPFWTSGEIIECPALLAATAALAA